MCVADYDDMTVFDYSALDATVYGVLLWACPGGSDMVCELGSVIPNGAEVGSINA